ncbi:MAG: hypothetical protein HGA96_03570 [Desulfobulbaceae bacterium]|nr:hypothetical protein [Desulfobulbaceae bacterium]
MKKNAYFETVCLCPEAKKLCVPPSVYIALKRPPQSVQERLLLSPQLMSESEIDCFFNDLIAELQQLCGETKKSLKKKQKPVRLASDRVV